MTIVDAIFILLFAGVLPVVSWKQYQDLLRKSPELIAANRRSYYKSTIFVQWILGFILIALWIFEDRSWNSLGFTSEVDWGFPVAILITVGSLAYFYHQLRGAENGDMHLITKLKAEFGDTLLLVPHNAGDLGPFYGLSITAGIIEEILFRGYFIWFFAQFLPLWAAAVTGIVLFALAHSYQGFKQFPMLLVISTVLMVVFLLSGSLWLPMFLHAIGDMIQGKLAYTIMKDDNTTLETA